MESTMYDDHAHHHHQHHGQASRLAPLHSEPLWPFTSADAGCVWFSGCSTVCAAWLVAVSRQPGDTKTFFCRETPYQILKTVTTAAAAADVTKRWKRVATFWRRQN